MRTPYAAIGGITLLVAVAYLVGYELWKWIGAMF